MHRIFQRDLYLLRLNTARAFVNALKTSSNPISGSEAEEPIKLSAQILGLGPVFRLILGLCNTSSGKPSRNLMITFYCDDKLYSISNNLIRVPMLVPGLEYTFETLVECVSDLGISDQIRVFVISNKSADPDKKVSSVASKPILSAVINMPVAEVV
jgi:Bardet-Biedl syndrome 1 protein